MQAKINELELNLLAYLHEHAAGYSDNQRFPPEDIANGLGCTIAELVKAATYLAGWGLVGLWRTPAVVCKPIAPIYLTHLGENYMRTMRGTTGGRREPDQQPVGLQQEEVFDFSSDEGIVVDGSRGPAGKCAETILATYAMHKIGMAS